MPSIANAFNEQMTRIAHRQVNRHSKVIRKLLAQHRRDIAALKRQLTQLKRAIHHLGKQRPQQKDDEKGIALALQEPSEGGTMRFRSDGLRTHRTKLGLSAADYGKLLGVSGLTVYHWERRKSKPRRRHMPRIGEVRGLGKREAIKRLTLMK